MNGNNKNLSQIKKNESKKFLSKKMKNNNFVFFIVIAVFYLIGNLLWYKFNNPIVVQGAYNTYFIRALLEGEYFFEIAPLIIWIMKGFLSVFGNKYFDLEIIFINYFFFLLALYFINRICIEIKDKETGLIAMILFALTPAVYGASRQYGHLDYHIMSISILNIYSLIKLEEFTDRKWSVIYGISVGFGLLSKDAFLAYFFVPWAYVAIKSLMKKNNKQKIINILITICLGSFIAGCHYFNTETVTKILQDPFIESAGPAFSFSQIRIFTIGLSEYLLSFPVFLFFLLGLFWYVFKYENRNYKYIILLWFIVPWIILMLMKHNRQPDYGLGLIPAIIVVISLYISNIKNKLYKTILSVILVCVCLLQYISFSYGINLDLYKKLKINFKGYNFYCFDTNQRINQRDAQYPNIVIYSNKKRDYALSLLKYLNNNFKDNTIYMYKDMLTTFFVMKEIRTLLLLQNCKPILKFEEILDADVIIFTKKDSFIDTNYLVNTIKQFLSEHFGTYDDENLEKDIKSKINEIKNNYIKLDEFGLYNNASEQDCIIVLGKKDLFEHNGDLKYKYSPLRFNKHEQPCFN